MRLGWIVAALALAAAIALRMMARDTPSVSPLIRTADSGHPTEGEHRSAEQLFWRDSCRLSKWTFGTAIVALLFSVLSVYFTGRQAIVAQQTMVSSSRAWMDVGDEITVASLT